MFFSGTISFYSKNKTYILATASHGVAAQLGCGLRAAAGCSARHKCFVAAARRRRVIRPPVALAPAREHALRVRPRAGATHRAAQHGWQPLQVGAVARGSAESVARPGARGLPEG